MFDTNRFFEKLHVRSIIITNQGVTPTLRLKSRCDPDSNADSNRLLRTLTKGADEIKVEGKTVKEIIENLEANYKGIKERICDNDGQIRRFINFYLNDEDIRFINNLNTLVKDGDYISIVPAIAGGPGTNIDIDGHLHRDADIAVYIGDPSPQEAAVMKLEEGIIRLMETMDYELGYKSKPERSSWFRQFLFHSKKALSSPEVHKVYEEAKEALRLKAIDEQASVRDQRLAAAAKDLIHSIKPFDNVSIRLGDILLVKYKEGKKNNLIVERVSQAIARDLEDNPALLKNPKRLMAFLETKGREIPRSNG